MGLKILTVDSFDANNTLQFKDPFASPTGFKSFNEGVTQLFYVLYDIGEDIPVINSTKISAKLSQFFGIGSQSKLPLSPRAVRLANNRKYLKELLREKETLLIGKKSRDS